MLGSEARNAANTSAAVSATQGNTRSPCSGRHRSYGCEAVHGSQGAARTKRGECLHRRPNSARSSRCPGGSSSPTSSGSSSVHSSLSTWTQQCQCQRQPRICCSFRSLVSWACNSRAFFCCTLSSRLIHVHPSTSIRATQASQLRHRVRGRRRGEGSSPCGWGHPCPGPRWHPSSPGSSDAVPRSRQSAGTIPLGGCQT